MAEILTVSNSKIKTWRRCRNMFHYKYIMNLERIKPKKALIKGRIIHEMIEAYTEDKNWKKILKRYEKQYYKLFLEEREEYGDLIGDLKVIMSNYIDEWEVDELKYLSKDDKKSEFEFEVPLIEGKVNLTGKIDAIAEDSYGSIWIVERKTFKGNIPSEDFRFSDIQTVIYGWAAPQIGFPKSNGVMWDYIRSKPPAIPEVLKNGQLSKRKNIDTTYPTYLQTIKEHGLDPKNYKDILESLRFKGEKFFRRIFLPSPTWVTKTLLGEIIDTALEIYYLGNCSRTRTLSWECAPGKCEYYSLCHAELCGLDTDYIISKEYQERKGDYGEEKETG